MSFDGSDYVVPRYRAPDDTAFYHFLHGTVPGHQIDFLYRPDVPQGALTQTHFGHLARLIKYIEPRQNAQYAFALGNLSRDDVQHEPGHGGLALLFALRVPGVTDHAGRDMPPYAHGVVAVNRALDYVTLLDAGTVLYRRFLEREGADDRRGAFYRTYFRTALEQPDDLESFLAQHIAEFGELPHPGRSHLGWDFVADDAAPARRITIVHDDDEGFGSLVHRAAALGSLLYRSNIKWTSITSGREIDIAGGTTIRFVPRSEAPSEAQGPCHAIDDLPEDEDELAMLLFGAKRRIQEVAAPRQGWREKFGAQRVPAVRSEPPPPPRTPLPPAPDDSSDAVDRAEVDDAAATLPMAPLEPDPAVPSPSFDARQSSSTKGMAAVDLRRSSPVGGMCAPVLAPAASAAADLRRSSPVGGMRAPVLAPAASGPVSAPPAALLPVPGSVAVDDGSIDVEVEPRGGSGRWIVLGAAAAAVCVIAVVAVSFGWLDQSSSGASQTPGEDVTAPSGFTPPASTPSAPKGTEAAPPPSADIPPTQPTSARASVASEGGVRSKLVAPPGTTRPGVESRPAAPTTSPSNQRGSGKSTAGTSTSKGQSGGRVSGAPPVF